MSPKLLSVVEPVPLPAGSAKYQAAREFLLHRLATSVPEDLILPRATIEDPPQDVTSVPRDCGLLSKTELDITESYDAAGLAEAIASKRYSAVQVTTAFAKRAIIAHQLTSCLTEWFLDDALVTAKRLDDYQASTGNTVGPLHGVPVSIKVHMPVAGHWSNVGYLTTAKEDNEDCQMVRILREAGAVFYCKTNQPQAIMHLESVSPLGRVLNPYNINLSAGGSSGGEAALIAMRGSVLGVGTDIGGSIRCPAAFCGIYGFKGTSYTLPTKDYIDGGASVELNILCSTGPMCRSLRDMELFMSVVHHAKPYLEDPRLIPLPWTGISYAADPTIRPLKVGFMMHDGAIMPQPPVTKALQWARSLLEAAPDRFHVKAFEPYRSAEAMRNIRLAYWPDGGRVVRGLMKECDEPIFPLTEWILKDAAAAFAGEDGQNELVASQVYEQRLTRDAFRTAFAAHWNAQDVDIVICPAFVGPACAHDTAWYWNYTAFWNYVDYPGVVVPTKQVVGKKGDDADYLASEPLSEECKRVRELWKEGDFEGAPMNIQVVARRYHDHDLFNALGALKHALDLT